MQSCPTRELLRRWLADQCPAAETDLVGAHVDACSVCQQTLEELTIPAAGPRRHPEPANQAGPSSPGFPCSGPSVESGAVFLRRLEKDPLMGPGQGPLPPPTRITSSERPEAGPADASDDWLTIPGYTILAELGRGGMGVVYLALQEKLKRQVALKVIRDGALAGTECLARFRLEAEVIASLHHPHIVQIHDFGECRGRPYFALELIPGSTLDQLLGARRLSVPDVVRLLATLARAMHHAHEHGIIHRDLKPGNILMQGLHPGQEEPGGASTLPIPKITDFGLAKRLDNPDGATATGQLMGTPRYMAPEQATGQIRLLGPATDIHALGCILYEALTGFTPFPRPTLPPRSLPFWPRSRQSKPFVDETVLTLQGLLEQVHSQDPVPPTLLQRGLPRDLETICLKCLRKEPHKRYGSALELAEDLERFGQHRPIRARPTPRWERLRKWCRRRPTTAALTGVAALLLLLSAVVLTGTHLRLRRTAETDLRAGREAAERKQWSEAEVHLDNVQKWTAHDPLAGDLHRKARQLRWANAGYRQSLKQHDEVMFYAVYVAVAAGHGLSAPPLPAEMEEEQLSWLSERQRAEFALHRYEILLVLAEIEARPNPADEPAVKKQRAARALAILEQVPQFRRDTHSYRQRRARYLGQLGAGQDQERENALAEAAPPASAFDHFLNGFDLLLERDPEQAVRSFDLALRLQADHFWSQFYLAAGHLGLRNWLAAKAVLNTCWLLRPDFPWIPLLRGIAQTEMGEFSAGEADFQLVESILEQEPASEGTATPFSRQIRAALHHFRGILCYRQQRLAEAISHFDQAIAKEPTLEMAHFARLRVYLEQDQLEQAAKHFPAFADLHPPPVYLAEYHTLLARQLSRMGKHQEAVLACQLALAAQADHVEAFAIQGQEHLHLQDCANADASFTRYLELGGRPSAGIFWGRGQARMKLDRYHEAGYDYTRALELSTSPIGAMVVLGLPATVGLHGPNPKWVADRGWAWYFSKAHPLALHDFESARKFLPCDSEIYTGLGLCRVELGQVREALVDAQRALEFQPANPEMMFNVACIYALAAGKILVDPNQPDRLTLEKECRTRAVAGIRSALRMLPREQQRPFWHKTVLPDRALDPIRDSAEFVQLQKEFSLELQQRNGLGKSHPQEFEKKH